MNYLLKKKEDVKNVLDRLNYFHDGFIKELCLTSHDKFDSDKSQFCTGEFSLKIDFAHYNYDEGRPPFNRIIRCFFKDVKDFNFNFRNFRLADGAITLLEIEETERCDNNYDIEVCFVLKIRFNFYQKKENKWTEVKQTLFSFREVQLEEK